MAGKAKAILSAANAELSKLGLKERKLGIFTSEPGPGFLGWLGLNTATRKHTGVGINPVVGVRCQELERRVGELLNERVHAYVPPTISCPLGYLMPERAFRMWNFHPEEPTGPELDSMVDAIKRFGLPFMVRMASLEAVADALASAGFGIPEHKLLRLPVAEIMLDRCDSARRHIEVSISELLARKDSVAARHRGFLERLGASLDGKMGSE